VADVAGRGPGNGLLYGVIGALCVVVAGGGYYIYQNSQNAPAPAQTAQPAPPAAPPVQAAPRPAPAPAGPSANQLSQARALIIDARRLAAAGNFAEAEAALQNADRIVPGFGETAAARREIAEQRTTHGSIGPLLTQMRRALERNDFAQAHRALDQAIRIDPNAPEVIAAQRELRAAERQGDRIDNRIGTLVANARAAIARGDYAAADRALDEAERIDARDPAVINTRNLLLEATNRAGRPSR
jgi:tetratricopeptide (TPR) repeat protein